MVRKQILRIERRKNYGFVSDFWDDKNSLSSEKLLKSSNYSSHFLEFRMLY
jgi:hypothetical protein